jgi:hypothetical protein
MARIAAVLLLDQTAEFRYQSRSGQHQHYSFKETYIMQTSNTYSVGGYDARYLRDTIVKLGGRWTILGANTRADYALTIIGEQITGVRMQFGEGTPNYNNEDTAKEDYSNAPEAIPYGIEWHMIVRTCTTAK